MTSRMSARSRQLSVNFQSLLSVASRIMGCFQRYFSKACENRWTGRSHRSRSPFKKANQKKKKKQANVKEEKNIHIPRIQVQHQNVFIHQLGIFNHFGNFGNWCFQLHRGLGRQLDDPLPHGAHLLLPRRGRRGGEGRGRRHGEDGAGGVGGLGEGPFLSGIRIVTSCHVVGKFPKNDK